MPTICKITLDAAEYRQELEKVIAESRSGAQELEESFTGSTDSVQLNVESNASSVTAETKDELESIPDKTVKVNVENDSSDAVNPAEELADAADKSAGKTNGLFSGLKDLTNGLGEQIGKGATAVGALGAVAGASVPPVGALAAVVNALLSPIALITAALSALVMIGMAVWDKLTISTEEHIEAAKQASEAAQRQLDKTKELSSAAEKYISRLKELASAEAADNRHKAETATLIAALESKYGSLGAEVDRTTGKIKNLAEVEARLEQRRRKQLAQKHFDVAAAAEDEAKAAYVDLTSSWYGPRSAESAGRIWDDQKRLGGGLDALLKRMETQARNATTMDEKKGYAAIAAKLRAAIDARNKGRKMKSTGFETDDERIEALASAQAGAASSTGALADARRDARHRRSDDAFADAATDEAKRTNRLARLQEEQEQYTDLSANVARAREELARIRSKKDEDGNVADPRAEADAVKRVADAELAVERNLDRQYSLKRQLAELDKQRAQNAKNLRDSLHSQAQDLYFQALEQSGHSEQARSERAIAEAERTKGGKLTDEERSRVEQLSNLSATLQRLQQGSPGADWTTKTNSLASRGGFASSVRLSDGDKYNRQMLDKTERLIAAANSIKTLIQDLGF